jgi:small nuclear ribonucleoprotein (snRNP)-like protein
MEEEMIKITVLTEINEVQEKVDNFDGLCFYFANNIKNDLDALEIKADIKNICDFTDNNYDHYFVIAGSHGEYLIDPSFIQFVSNNGKLIAFDEWPATVLKNTNEDMANGLIKYGYVKLENDDLKQYLGSFIEKSKVKR